MKNHFKNRQEKGITLVALVVTLIVPIICAGVPINANIKMSANLIMTSTISLLATYKISNKKIKIDSG